MLLTRHITDKDDFADNKEFIAVVVYKGDGRRVFYPCKYTCFTYLRTPASRFIKTCSCFVMLLTE